MFAIMSLSEVSLETFLDIIDLQLAKWILKQHLQRYPYIGCKFEPTNVIA